MKIGFATREKAVYIKFRRDYGYSINHIARVFGRSTSVIHRVLARARITTRDMRKIPNYVRTQRRLFQWARIQKYFPKWQNFIFAESEKPP